MIALHPTPFQQPHAHILIQVWELPNRKFFGVASFASIPACCAKVLMKPSVEKIESATAYTKTQLIKFGIVVNA